MIKKIKQTPLVIKAAIALSLVLVVIITSALMTNSSLQNITTQISEEVRPDLRLAMLKEMLYRTSQAESQVRSHGITGENEYLMKYDKSVNAVDRTVKEMLEMSPDTSRFYANVQEIHTLVLKKFDILDTLIQVQKDARLTLLMDEVQSSLEDVNSAVAQAIERESESTTEEEPVPEEQESGGFFDRLRNRKNKEEESTEPETTAPDEVVESSIHSSFSLIDREMDQIAEKATEKEKELKQKELQLITADQEITKTITQLAEELEIREEERIQEQLVSAEKKAASTRLIIALFCVLSCLLMVIGGYLIFRYIQKNNAYKRALRLSKQETESKNRSIVASINYAQRIQQSILPSQRTVNALFSKSFLIYKPKDIVAGDFYWMTKTDQYTYVAVADCTGHGVPGAMVSMSCSGALSRSVNEFHITDPAKILEKCREIIKETFHEGEYTIYDGMDVGLCRISNTTNELVFAGANNGLYHNHKGELTLIRPDKQPVARYMKQQPFTNHVLHPEKGDLFYLYTDGFADQFGGKRGKKMMARRFQDSISKAQNIPISDQEKLLSEAFAEWKGAYEQVDDVCVFGFEWT